jgi:molybdopterin synthase sulfur carrier subunit
MIDLIYFSWIRERIGKSSEAIETKAATVVELIEELKVKDIRYSEVFSDLGSFRVAINQELADFNAPIIGAKEIAFFPPMTGG